MNLTKTAISRPIFMLMLMLAAIFMGWTARNSMRVEENPEVAFGIVTISTVYPGAGPDEINTLISRKIEEVCAGVSGIREVTASSQEGISIVVANFEIGTNMDAALNDVRTKVDGIAGELPLTAEKPVISKLDFSASPVLNIVARSGTLSKQELRDLADNKLKDIFAKVPGVASVAVQGGDIREIQVRLKQEKLLAYGLGIAQIQRAVQAATLNVPSGRVVAGDREFAVRVLGEFKTLDNVRDMRLTIQDFSNPNAKGASVRLGDIADINDSVVERTSYSRLDGEDTVVFIIQKAREGNAVEISKAIVGGLSKGGINPKVLAEKLEKKQPLTILEQLKTQYDVDTVVTLNQATTISESLSDLNFSLFFGIMLVALIVYIFLHDWRGTLIVAIAIPVCIFATFIAMKALGFTINNLSMLALSLAVGVLVDDAIVVLENIHRHLRMGEDPREAAINGRSEIGLAAIAITLADVVVFLPIGFMGGIVGQFFRPLGIGFAVTVLLSLFVSFTITPMLASRWYKAGEDLEHFDKGFAGWFERRFAGLQSVYRRMLEWCLAHRWFVFIFGNCVLVAVFMLIAGSFVPYEDEKKLPLPIGPALQVGMGPAIVAVVLGIVVFIINLFRKIIKPQFILYGLLFGLMFPAASLLGFQWAKWKHESVFKFGFFPPSDQGSVAIDITLPPGSSLAATSKVVERVEKVVMKHPDAKYVLSQVGGAGGGGFNAGSVGSQLAKVTVTLNEKVALMDSIAFWKKHEGEMRTQADTDVAAQMLEAVGKVPGAQIKISASGAQGFGSPIQMSFKGSDRDQVVDVAATIQRRLASGEIPGLINVDISSKPGKPEFRAIPDHQKLADAGVSVADVAGAMRILYEGNRDTKFRVGGQEYDIRVMVDIEDRNNPALVTKMPIAFDQGNPIYLGSVATIVPGVGVDKIDRRDREEEIRVTADLLPGFDAGGTQAKIDTWIKEKQLLPDGVTTKPLGQADFQATEGIYLFTALFTGIILVYMLLAALFENLLYPLIIQMAQPQAMVGALLALMITDKVLNIVGFIGLICLVGLVGKNAILLVDYTNTLRSRGRSRHDALVEAGPTRLRPILMTTLALIFGMLPVALAIGRGSEFRETIGISIIGGMLLSTLLTLLVIPCSYTIFDDMSNLISRKKRDEVAGLVPPEVVPYSNVP